MKWNTLIFISLQSCQQLFTMATKVKVPFVGGHFVLVNILLILMLKTQFITLKINLVKHTPHTNDFPLDITCTCICIFIIRCFSTGGVTIHKVKVTLDKATVNN